MQSPFLHIIVLYYMQKVKKIVKIIAYFILKHMQKYCQTKGGSTTTHRNSFIRMCKLHDVRGRITYISSHAKQEDLYATIRKKRLSGKKPMKQGLRVIQCMSEYRIIKERNLYDSQNRLHKERTEGRDDRPLTYTHINSLSLIC